MHKNTRYYITEYDDRTVIRVVPIQAQPRPESDDASDRDTKQRSQQSSSRSRIGLRQLAKRGLERTQKHQT